MTAIVDVRYRTNAAEDSFDNSSLAYLSRDLFHVTTNSGVRLVIILTHLLCLRSREPGALRETKRTDHVRDGKVHDLCQSPRFRLFLFSLGAEHVSRCAR